MIFICAAWDLIKKKARYARIYAESACGRNLLNLALILDSPHNHVHPGHEWGPITMPRLRG